MFVIRIRDSKAELSRVMFNLAKKLVEASLLISVIESVCVLDFTLERARAV